MPDPTTKAAEFVLYLYFKVKAIINITVVKDDTIELIPSLIVTKAIKTTEATLTPSKKPETNFESLKLSTNLDISKTIINDGRNIPIVATTPPKTPFKI